MSLSPLLYLLCVSSGVFLLTFAIVALIPRLSAARRLLVWQAAFAAVTACSPLAFLDVSIPLPILPSERALAAPKALFPPSSLSRNEAPTIAPVGPLVPVVSEVKSIPDPSSPRLGWPIVVWAVWGLGVSITLLRSGFGFLILYGVRRRSALLGRADGEGLLSAEAKEGIRVYASEEIGTPMAVGILTPAIIVPTGLVSEAGRSLQAVLLHESSHAKRGDVFFLAVAGILSAIHWFNPLVWLATAMLRAEAERAADDDALSGAISPTEYAEILLSAARRLKSTDRRLFPASRMAEGSKLGSRLSHLLDMSADRSAPTANGRRLAIFGVIIIAAVILTVRPVTASSPETAASGEVSPADPNRKLPEDLKTASVIITDEAGNPVSGAQIVLEGLRSSVDPGSWYGLDEELIGQLADVSGNDGRAELKYPPFAQIHYPTSQLCVSVRAPGFAKKDDEFGAENSPSTILLQKSATLESHAVGVEGLKGQLTAQFEGEANGAEIIPWRREGATVVGEVPPGAARLRLIFRVDDGRYFFSDVENLDLRPDERKAVELTMREGVSVKGSLDASVPRPVKDGWVRAVTMEKSQGGRRSLHMAWLVKAAIGPEGNFVLPPMPPGEMNVIAACDGFVSSPSADPIFAGMRHMARSGQVFASEGPLVMKMERTGTAMVQVLAPDAQPLAGAEVSFWPNESTGDGATVFGGSTPTSETLGLEPSSDWDKRAVDKLRKITDANGFVEMTNLPAGTFSVVVNHSSYEMPLIREVPDSPGRPYRFLTVEPGGATAERVTMTPKNKEGNVLPRRKIIIQVTLLEIGDEATANSPEFKMALSGGDIKEAERLAGRRSQMLQIPMGAVSSGDSAKGDNKQVFSYPVFVVPPDQVKFKAESLGMEFECVPTLFPESIGLELTIRSRLLVESGRFPRFRSEEMTIWRDVSNGGVFGVVLPWEQGLGPNEGRDGFNDRGYRMAVFVKAEVEGKSKR